MRKSIRVFYSVLSGRFYATAHYTIKDRLVTVTGEKFDVTNDIGAAIDEHKLEFKAAKEETPHA